MAQRRRASLLFPSLSSPSLLLLLTPLLSWTALVGVLSLTLFQGSFLTAQESQPSSTQTARLLGTVKAISDTTITVSSDTGSDITVVVQQGARLLRVEPGQKELKDAAPLQLQEIQLGDRLLVRGKMAADG